MTGETHLFAAQAATSLAADVAPVVLWLVSEEGQPTHYLRVGIDAVAQFTALFFLRAPIVPGIECMSLPMVPPEGV